VLPAVEGVAEPLILRPVDETLHEVVASVDVLIAEAVFDELCDLVQGDLEREDACSGITGRIQTSKSWARRARLGSGKNWYMPRGKASMYA
jgi:hypothetical protein